MHSHPVISYHKVIKYSILRTKKSLPVRQTLFYGDNGTRTRGLCVANASLSQLSYIPMQIYCNTIIIKIKHFFLISARLLRPGTAGAICIANLRMPHRHKFGIEGPARIAAPLPCLSKLSCFSKPINSSLHVLRNSFADDCRQGKFRVPLFPQQCVRSCGIPTPLLRSFQIRKLSLYS